MAKKSLKIEEVESTLKDSEIDNDKVIEVIEKLNSLLLSPEESNEDTEKQEKQFVVLVYDKNGIITEPMTGTIVQIDDNENPMEANVKLVKACQTFNMSKKGRKMPVRSIAEGCEAVPRRFFKEENIHVKNKIPVYIIPSNNELIIEE